MYWIWDISVSSLVYGLSTEKSYLIRFSFSWISVVALASQALRSALSFMDQSHFTWVCIYRLITAESKSQLHAGSPIVVVEFRSIYDLSYDCRKIRIIVSLTKIVFRWCRAAHTRLLQSFRSSDDQRWVQSTAGSAARTMRSIPDPWLETSDVLLYTIASSKKSNFKYFLMDSCPKQGSVILSEYFSNRQIVRYRL